jgi:hypothetical protein
VFRSIGRPPSLGCKRSAGEDDFDTLLAPSAARFTRQNYKGEPNTLDRFRHHSDTTGTRDIQSYNRLKLAFSTSVGDEAKIQVEVL